MSDSVVLTLAGSSFHHCGAKTEKSWAFVVQTLLALNDGGTRHPAEVGRMPFVQTTLGVYSMVDNAVFDSDHDYNLSM